MTKNLKYYTVYFGMTFFLQIPLAGLIEIHLDLGLTTDNQLLKGALWLSGRVLDSRLKCRGFKPHRRHCVVVIEQDTFILA